MPHKIFHKAKRLWESALRHKATSSPSFQVISSDQAVLPDSIYPNSHIPDITVDSLHLHCPFLDSNPDLHGVSSAQDDQRLAQKHPLLINIHSMALCLARLPSPARKPLRQEDLALFTHVKSLLPRWRHYTLASLESLHHHVTFHPPYRNNMITKSSAFEAIRVVVMLLEDISSVRRQLQEYVVGNEVLLEESWSHILFIEEQLQRFLFLRERPQIPQFHPATRLVPGQYLAAVPLVDGGWDFALRGVPLRDRGRTD